MSKNQILLLMEECGFDTNDSASVKWFTGLDSKDRNQLVELSRKINAPPEFILEADLGYSLDNGEPLDEA
jgi:hypothetical protein